MAKTPERTALGPMVIVAVDQFEPVPLIDDPLAAELLPAAGKFAVALTRWPPLRRAMVSAEFTTRYLHPAGRDLPVSKIERSVLAEFTG